ncbi:catechol 2,3-dioxygenase-like lactoylglutathione lyase family enzyme [Friedmanniella endophytica]|uniref:Catechol 2,3-dioxygenase-like lactoylglutathione lyase family enzyme n=1 Tax=Microlunatus kandeliicorticis TaxID=1759536 RepID=A0A7W3P5I7_9ACTN|nr:VOC family protein [Microlunatus kandeliicorticis]MBA8793978.1 catechol 2,3-dioxygenase-like lactoylglutathione lyase family enzyme [Microlunatus kandeliicorticis]
MDDSGPLTLTRALVVLDVPDLQVAADFWCRLLATTVVDTDHDWIALAPVAGLRLAFQWAPDVPAPTWPDPAVPQQAHLDLHVADLDAAEATVLAAGGRPVEGPGDDPSFRVYRDPSGHPFCLCRESGPGPGQEAGR